MKNTPKIIFSAFMLLGIIVSPVSAAFPDVSTDHIYSDAINYVQDEGIVEGFADGEFKPERTITRAEFTKIIVNSIYDLEKLTIGERTLNGLSKDIYGKSYDTCVMNTEVSPGGKVGSTIMRSGFPDILSKQYYYSMFAPEGSDFARYTCLAKVNKILDGYPDGTFRPDNLITVGEASKIISNAYGFTDLDSGPEGDVFKPFVDVLVERNALPEAMVDLDDDLLRGEMAEIVYRLDNEITSKNSANYEFLTYRLENYNFNEFYISNLTANSISVYWFTKEEIGNKLCLKNLNTQEVIEFDDNNLDKRLIHSTEISHSFIESNTSYEVVVDTNGLCEGIQRIEFTTPAEKTTYMVPDPIYGRVNNVEDGTGLVLVQLVGVDGGRSQILSTSLISNIYSVDIADIYSENNFANFDLDQNYTEEINIFVEKEGKIFTKGITVNENQDQPVVDISM